MAFLDGGIKVSNFPHQTFSQTFAVYLFKNQRIKMQQKNNFKCQKAL
jgi:hypothetical protein